MLRFRFGFLLVWMFFFCVVFWEFVGWGDSGSWIWVVFWGLWVMCVCFLFFLGIVVLVVVVVVFWIDIGIGNILVLIFFVWFSFFCVFLLLLLWGLGILGRLWYEVGVFCVLFEFRFVCVLLGDSVFGFFVWGDVWVCWLFFGMWELKVRVVLEFYVGRYIDI